MDDAERRYEEILRRIEQQKQWRASSNTGSLFAQQLDDLNIYDTLSQARDRVLPFQVHGPLTVLQDTWAGCVVWYPDRGVTGYRQLTIFGLWLVQALDDLSVILGARQSTYNAPVFVAEAYHKLMRKHWRPYYTDKGHPPAISGDTVLWQKPYTPDHRLSLRQQITQDVTDWMASI